MAEKNILVALGSTTTMNGVTFTVPHRFYCPYCLNEILTDNGNDHKKIPSVCPHCLKTLSRTFELYTPPAVGPELPNA
jgi:hypothetical protein